jgi:hypothetical protein
MPLSIARKSRVFRAGHGPSYAAFATLPVRMPGEWRRPIVGLLAYLTLLPCLPPLAASVVMTSRCRSRHVARRQRHRSVSLKIRHLEGSGGRANPCSGYGGKLAAVRRLDIATALSSTTTLMMMPAAQLDQTNSAPSTQYRRLAKTD